MHISQKLFELKQLNFLKQWFFAQKNDVSLDQQE